MDCFEKKKYIIKRGDTLFRLAYIFKTTEEKILAINPGLDPMNLQIGRVIEICPNTASMKRAVDPSNGYNGMTEKQIELHDKFRELWEQHNMYTRMVINAVVDPEPDDDAVTARLLRNPKDFAEVYRIFYGNAAAQEIDRLITEHLTEGKQLIAATANGEAARVEAINKVWYRNADEWVDYLNTISPNINEAAIRNMLYDHLDLIVQQVSSRMANNYIENVAIYDKSEKMVLEMADMMSNAIMHQFPEKFKK